MKRASVITFLSLALFASSLYAQQSSAVMTIESCQKFTGDFYQWYGALLQKELHEDTSSYAIKHRPQLFSAALLKLLRDDLKAAEKNPGEIVGLDFDPFVNSQDPMPRYSARKAAIKSDSCMVEVFGTDPSHKKQWADRDPKKPDVTAELKFIEKKWVFVNFHYGSESGKDGENLIAILHTLQKERAKSH